MDKKRRNATITKIASLSYKDAEKSTKGKGVYTLSLRDADLLTKLAEAKDFPKPPKEALIVKVEMEGSKLPILLRIVPDKKDQIRVEFFNPKNTTEMVELVIRGNLKTFLGNDKVEPDVIITGGFVNTIKRLEQKVKWSKRIALAILMARQAKNVTTARCFKSCPKKGRIMTDEFRKELMGLNNKIKSITEIYCPKIPERINAFGKELILNPAMVTKPKAVAIEQIINTAAPYCTIKNKHMEWLDGFLAKSIEDRLYRPMITRKEIPDITGIIISGKGEESENMLIAIHKISENVMQVSYYNETMENCYYAIVVDFSKQPANMEVLFEFNPDSIIDPYDEAEKIVCCIAAVRLYLSVFGADPYNNAKHIWEEPILPINILGRSLTV